MDFAFFGGGFEGAVGFGTVGAVVEAALAHQRVQIGEVAGQLFGGEVVQAEFLQAGAVD